MANFTRRSVLGLGLSSALALTLSACAKTAASSPSASVPNKLTVALPGALSNIYPGQEAGILNYYVAAVFSEGLVTLGADGSLQPGLADTWNQPDAKTYIYHLRDNAKFHDGSTVTTADVLASIEQARDATVSPGYASGYDNVASVTADQSNNITVTLVEPDVAFGPNLSTAGLLNIAPKSFWESTANVGTAQGLFVGSGPYKVTSFDPSTGVTLAASETWWGDTPTISEVTIKFIPDENTRLLARQQGDIDIAFNVPLTQASQWANLASTTVDYTSDLSLVGLRFKPNVAPFDDVHVRKAIALAFDKQTIVDKILQSHGEPATAITTPESINSQYSGPDARTLLKQSIPQYDFNLDAARAELQKSAHADGFSTTIYTPATGPQLRDAALALADNLKQLGITLTVSEVPIEQWFTKSIAEGIGYIWYFSTTGDPGEIAINYLREGNSAKYSNSTVIENLAAAQSETDPKARINTLLEAQKIAISDDAVVLPLWWGQSATAFPSSVKLAENTPYAFVSAWPTQIVAA